MSAGTSMNSGGRRHTVTLAVCYAAMMGMGITVNLMPVLLTTLSQDLGGAAGLTHEQLGRIGAVTFAGIVFGVLSSGPLADRWGARTFVLAGNIFFTAGLALLGLARAYPSVLAAAFIMGVGTGILDMILSPIVCALEPDRRASALNWLHSFFCLGSVVTVFAATWALQAGVAWRSLALSMAAFPAIVGVAFACVSIPPLIHETQQRTPLRRLFRERYFLAVLAVIFLSGASELGLTQWLPAYAEKTLGLSRWVSGMALLGFALAMTLGRFAAGWVGHRVKAVTLLVNCCWALIGLLLLGTFLQWPVPALVACVLVGFGVSPMWPTTLALAGDRYPDGGASMFGILTAVGNIGAMFMPWAVGVTADCSTMRIGLATVAICPLLIATVLIRISVRSAPAAMDPAAL